METQRLSPSSSWLRQRLHSQLQRLTEESDRLTRDEWARRLRVCPTESREGQPATKNALRMPADQVRRTDQYLQLLACCGGPFIHGEAISAFEFLTLVELIPEDDFWTIRSEEELSGWLDRIRVLSRCGYIEPANLDQARTKVQQLLRRRMMTSDVESQLWFATFCYLADRSAAPCHLLSASATA